MKKIATSLLVIASIAAFAVSAASAAPIFTEDFGYALGSGLNGQGGWAAHSGAGTNAQTVNTAGGLSYAGYPSSGVGNLLGPIATSGEDNNHTFTGASSGSVYAAVMLNVASAQAAGDYLFHLFDGAITGNNFYGRVFVKSSGAGYVLGLQFKSNTGATCTFYSSAVKSFNTTHLVVLKYTFNAGATNDQAALFIDPVTNCTEPVADVTINNTSTPCTGATVDVDATNLDGVAIRQGSAANAASAQIDGIRVANNWQEATCNQVTPGLNSSWGKVKVLYR
jgi:hypothetical protein